MAEAVIGLVVGKLQEMAMSEAKALVAVSDDIRSLRDKLMWMQAFLRDAEPRRRVQNDEHIRVWLQQTRRAVFDSEDAVDDFLHVDLSRFPGWTRPILKFFADCKTHICVRHDLSNRIKSINTRLDEIIANKDRYKMGEASAVPVLTWRPSAAISTTSTEEMDTIVLPTVARGNQLALLKTYLNAEADAGGPKVIYVTGKSGVGKTKLVRNMYMEDWTLKHFDELVWVSFAPNLSASNILKLIIQRLDEDNVTYSDDEVRQKLKELLQERNYLLVMDGEVTSTEWKQILSDLPDGKAGSKVVQITQTKPESSHATSETVPLDDLNPVDSANLFLETLLFMEDQGVKYRSAVKDAVTKGDYGANIFEITGGLPL